MTLVVTDNDATTTTQAQGITVVAPKLHVGDLDGASTVQQRTWTATVTIAVHDSAHGPVQSTAVSARWNDGSVSSCTTNASGQCVISRSGIPRKTTVSLTVIAAAHSAFDYNAAGNHDPDRDGDGTTISITRQ